MNDIRCETCGKKLAEETIQIGLIAIKCPRCGQISTLNWDLCLERAPTLEQS